MNIEQLCKTTEVPVPQVGQKLFVHSSRFIDHGYDDVAGGMATIEEVKYKYIPQLPTNSIMVAFKEISGHAYNYILLMEKQEELKKQYKGKIAHNDPG